MGPASRRWSGTGQTTCKGGADVDFRLPIFDIRFREARTVPVTNFNTYNGRIRSESRAGVITSYLTDALGSVTATVNQSQVVQNTFRYKPYGATLSQTGSGIPPGFLWTGDTGSRPTGLAQSSQYNRGRHYEAA